MADRLTLEALDGARERLHDLATRYARRLPALRYCDIRVEVREDWSAAAENGHPKASSEDYSLSFGVRVIAGEVGAAAPGYYGRILGAEDAPKLVEETRKGLRHAYERAVASARQKAEARARFGALADGLRDTTLAPVPVIVDTVPAVFKSDPRRVPLDDVSKMALDGCRAAAGVSSQIVYSVAYAHTGMGRELFLSSEGSDIEQTSALSDGMVFVVSRGDTGNLEIYDYTGHPRGWEVLTEGYHTGEVELSDFVSFAKKLATDAVQVSNAPKLEPPDKDVVIVTDPHFNALLVHEVVGHPSEADRALKYETAYAGRSWLFKDMRENQLGQQVASGLLSAFSDPTMDGLGFYKYDHDGTPARRAYHLHDGNCDEFLNSRQTAAILGVQPNGSFRATEAYLVPLIRMTNTVFAPGHTDPKRIVADVEDGWYVAGHRIPSIAESRENFRITAVKVYEIKNGQLGQVFRDGGVTADSRDYFMRVDAVGTDFRMYPIPNCGKGQPMQTKRMSNGGPTLRSMGRLTGGA